MGDLGLWGFELVKVRCVCVCVGWLGDIVYDCYFGIVCVVVCDDGNGVCGVVCDFCFCY